MVAPAAPVVTAKAVADGVISIGISPVAAAVSYRVARLSSGDDTPFPVATVTDVSVPVLDRTADDNVVYTYSVYASNDGSANLDGGGNPVPEEGLPGTATVYSWATPREMSPTSAERHARHG